MCCEYGNCTGAQDRPVRAYNTQVFEQIAREVAAQLAEADKAARRARYSPVKWVNGFKTCAPRWREELHYWLLTLALTGVAVVLGMVAGHMMARA